MNVNTNFLPVQTQTHWKLVKTQMIASVAMEEGAAVYAVGDGTHTIVTNATGNFRGILAEPIAATDADYATSKKLKSVYVPRDDESEVEFTESGDALTTDLIGETCKFNDSIGLDATAAGTQAKITGYINAGRGRAVLNRVIS